jgi:hypothetical protein
MSYDQEPDAAYINFTEEPLMPRDAQRALRPSGGRHEAAVWAGVELQLRRYGSMSDDP